MQNYHRIYYFIFLALLIFGCSSGDENDTISDKILPNEVYISGLKKDTYVVAQNGRIIISPIIKRENVETESDLDFEWLIGDLVVSTKRDLDIDLPFEVTNGEKKCQYKVTRSSDGKGYESSFNISVINPFGYGYYFLSVDRLGKTILSHININENQGTIFHTTRIGEAYIGKNGNSLHSNGKYSRSAQKIIYDLYITADSGDNLHIVTENVSFSVLRSISIKDVSVEFSPSSHVTGFQVERESFFISKGEIFEYEDNILTRRPTAGYSWTDIVAGNNNLWLYAKDKSSGQIFTISTADGYSVKQISGDLNLSNETIIATRSSSYHLDGGVADRITIITSAKNRLSTYVIDRGGITLRGSVEVSGVATGAVFIDDDAWYIGCGSTVYHYNCKTNSIMQHVVLEPSVGDITSLALTSKSNKLIIATETTNSTTRVGGSVVIYDNASGNITTYPNVIHRCVGIACCDEDKFD